MKAPTQKAQPNSSESVASMTQDEALDRVLKLRSRLPIGKKASSKQDEEEPDDVGHSSYKLNAEKARRSNAYQKLKERLVKTTT